MTGSTTEQLYREFWGRLADRLETRPETPLYVDEELDTTRNALPQRRRLPDGVHYALVSDANRGSLRVALRVRSDIDDVFRYLHADRAAIEEAVGESLEWSPGGEYATAVLEREGNVAERERWAEYLDWFIEYGETFDVVFRPYLDPFETD